MGKTNLCYLSISFLLYYVVHSFSVNAINRWCIHSYMVYDGCQLYWNQFICHGQTRQKIKTQRERCCDRTHSMWLNWSAAWSGNATGSVVARLASAPFPRSNLTQSTCPSWAAKNSGDAPSSAQVSTTSNLPITTSHAHALISGKRNSQTGVT